MLTLYGKGGRTFRSIWMLEEANIEYERVLTDWSIGESHTEEFLRLNPNGKVPVLRDGDMVVFESLAINYHVARMYAPQLWVGEDQISAAFQWLAWSMGELEGPHDAANRMKSEIDARRLDRSLAVLRQRLVDQEFMLGNEFTVVDLNTACLLLRPQYRPVVERDGEVESWLERCISRPALGGQ